MAQQTEQPTQPSGCHIFIDDQFIWTVEIVQSPDKRTVPLLNVITLSNGKWDFRPRHVHIFDQEGREAQVEKFSIDTGSEPYVTEYLKVLGNSFIGIDLLGRFEQFGGPSRIVIDLGDHRFELLALECGQFNVVADKINQINFDSPDIYEDYEVLGIEFLGKRGVAPLGEE